MATAQFDALLVAQAAKARIKEAEETRKADQEHYFTKLLERTFTSGSLWWKTTRPVTRDEAWERYETGYWPWSNRDWWGGQEKKCVEDTFKATVKRAKRLGALALAAYQHRGGSTVSLDEGEATFLRLGKEQSI